MGVHVVTSKLLPFFLGGFFWGVLTEFRLWSVSQSNAARLLALNSIFDVE